MDEIAKCVESEIPHSKEDLCGPSQPNQTFGNGVLVKNIFMPPPFLYFAHYIGIHGLQTTRYEGIEYRICTCFELENYSLPSINLTILYANTYRILTPSNYPHDSTFVMNGQSAPLQFIKVLRGNRTRGILL